MQKNARQVFLTLFLCLPLFFVLANDEKTTIQGRKHLFIGHSFFIPVANEFKKLCPLANIQGHQQESIQSPGPLGSPKELWKGAKKNLIKRILAKGETNVLGMTYYDTKNSRYEDYQKWVDYALKYNEDCLFFIGVPWTKRPMHISKQERAIQVRSVSKSLQSIIKKLQSEYPQNHFLYCDYSPIAPKVRMLYESKKIDKAPFSDKLGHATKNTKILAAMLWLQQVYDIDLAQISFNSTTLNELKKIAIQISPKAN